MEEISLKTDKKEIFSSIKKYLSSKGLSIKKLDNSRPWGGFFVIDESSLPTFIDLYFPGFEASSLIGKHTLSPKILLVQPGKRLSWQYHHRRSEIWSVAAGVVGIVLSDNDDQQPAKTYTSGDMIKIKQGERHRLVGLDDWGIVAEIWVHEDSENPSNEDDIIRLDDDFGR